MNTTVQRPGSRLLEPPRRWVQRRGEHSEDTARTLAAALELPLALSRLLVLRGHGEPERARTFLKPQLDDLHDPLLMRDAERAVERITRAIRRGERILVHGDYDVDGICGASLYTRVLRSLGADVEPFVPHRMTDGYDLGQAGVRKAIEVGAALILTADCGVVAHDAISEACAHGLDVIVTDHHTPGSVLPAAFAVLNPNRSDCGYPFKGLAGAGVAYKLCQALVSALGGDADALRWHLDMVALATIADLAPLSGENRVLAHYGLRVLSQTRNPGLRALLQSAGVATEEPIGAGQVSHVLAPRLNAVGRMGAASRGVRLLLQDDATAAEALAQEMEAENRTRQSVDRAMLDEALEMLDTGYDPERDYAVVLSREGWHPGVIGIVASRVVERIHRPVVLISEDRASGRGRGSARSIPAFHLYDGIHACAPLLERYGGHRQAAGMDLRLERVAAFRERLNEHARAALAPEDLTAEVKIDLEISLRDADGRLCRLMRHCGPFGIANPQPIFVARRVRAERVSEVGDGQHVRMLLVQDGATLPAIAFRLADRFRTEAGAAVFDVAFQLQQDQWNGRDRLQARVIDLRRSE